MEKYIYNEQNGLWYELQGDYYISCLVLDEEDQLAEKKAAKSAGSNVLGATNEQCSQPGGRNRQWVGDLP